MTTPERPSPPALTPGQPCAVLSRYDGDYHKDPGACWVTYGGIHATVVNRADCVGLPLLSSAERALVEGEIAGHRRVAAALHKIAGAQKIPAFAEDYETDAAVRDATADILERLLRFADVAKDGSE